MMQRWPGAHAARQLVGATLKGRPEVAPTLSAKIGMRVHGVAPTTTMRLISLVNRLLPTDETPRPLRPGHAVERPARWFDTLRGLTRRGAALPPARRPGARPRPVDPSRTDPALIG